MVNLKSCLIKQYMATKISALRGRVMKRLVDEVTMAFAKITMKSLQVSLKAIFCNIVRQILQLVSKLPKSGT